LYILQSVTRENRNHRDILSLPQSFKTVTEIRCVDARPEKNETLNKTNRPRKNLSIVSNNRSKLLRECLEGFERSWRCFSNDRSKLSPKYASTL